MKRKISLSVFLLLLVSSLGFTQNAPTIEVKSPNGGENWEIGSTQKIEWSSENVPRDAVIRIEISRGGQFDLTPVFDGLNNNTPREKDWVISGTATARAKIKVTATFMDNGETKTASDESANDFQITPIKVLSPNAGNEVWEIGSAQIISWTTTAEMPANAEMKIEISRGGSFEVINAVVPNQPPRSFEWEMVSEPSTEEARIRISTTLNGVSFFDESDEDFIVCEQAELKVTADTLDFGKRDESLPLAIEKIGTCPLRWTAQALQSWITLEAVAGDAPQSIKVIVERDSLCGGTSLGQVAVQGSDGSQDTVQVRVEVANVGPTIRAGYDVSNFSLFAKDTGAVFIYNLDRVFEDRDGDDLDYKAVSTKPEIVRSKITRNELELKPLAIGEAIVEVTTTDAKCASAKARIEVTVGNRRPRLRKGRIPDVTLIISGPPVSMNLDSLFVDDDNDILFYTMTSLRGFAHAENFPTNYLAVVAPQNPGQDTVSVIADDGKGTPLVIRFAALVKNNQRPIVVNQTEEGGISVGTALTIKARIIDDVVVQTGTPDYLRAVTLYYRRGGILNFTPISMQLVGVNSYQSVVSESDVTDRGLEYFIEATDTGDSSGRAPDSDYFSSRVRVPMGLSKALSHGKNENDYRLFSVPLDLSNKDAKTVLEDDKNLGKYDDSKWRFAEPQSDGSAKDFPEVSSLQVGKAFWLLVKEVGKSINTGEGTTNRTDKPFEIHLNAGWNFIGNPFNFEIPVADRHVWLKHGIFSGAQTYLGSWQKASILSPFEGYAIYNHSSSADTLLIAPNFSPTSSEPAQAKPLWEMRILAVSQNARDVNNSIVILNEASANWDRNDEPEPPFFGSYIALFFPHPEWRKMTHAFTTDARPSPLTGETWDFEVISNIHDRVDLTFEGVAQVPSEFEVWLVDEQLQITRDLRAENHYSIVGPSPANPKRLKLVVGKKEYVGEITKQVEATLTTFELSQNFPNPFNPATEIRYGLPHAARVTLRVYNMLGEEVAVPVQEEWKTPGYHTAIWNGRNAGGERVGSGVYLYKLQAGSFTHVRKMLLLQ